MAASAAADVFPQQKYDVFLSFRGSDTRRKFTSHLYAALHRKKIYTYMDDRLERGDEIRPALLTAIERSKLSVIIFSKDYASSSWCLDEVVHILKCKQVYGQLVVPVFYEIDPSHVRWQQGTYADAFAILEERFKDNMDKVRNWRDAFTTAANISGFHSQNIWLESELVDTIVKDISKKLNRNSSYVLKGLVGMESHIQQIELLLCINTQDVCFRTVGIWGVGGTGKTTLADSVFHRNSSEFDVCLFLANVKEESEKHGLHYLRNKFLRELLKEESLDISSPSIGSSYIIDRLSRTKVLVVLDDVSDLSQLEVLLGDQVDFGPGSRIIITTRNRRLLKKRVHEDHIYKMNELYVDEALQLFQSFVFEDDSSITDYSNLSREVVDYVGGNPLALKVLASSLFVHCNNREDWEQELKKLKKLPNTNIQNVLRLSYNGLEESQATQHGSGKRQSQQPPVLEKQESHLIRLGALFEEFSLQVLIEATNNFSEEHKIGTGSFGSVYYATLDDGGCEMAVKRAEPLASSFGCGHTKRQEDKDNAFVNELEFLSRLHHKNLVRLLGFYEDTKERILVYEYMNNGTLHDHLHKIPVSPLLSWSARIQVALDAARGIEYLHMYAVPSIIHRDIKSSNILLDNKWRAKVSDFGLSLMGPEDDESYLSMRAAGTVGYIDPEYYRLQQLTTKSDVYSFGVVLLELLSGYRAIHKNENQEPRSVVDFVVPFIVNDEIHRVLDPKVPPPTPFEIEAVAYVGYLAADCVNPEGRDRPSMTEIASTLERALAYCLSDIPSSSKKKKGSGSLTEMTEIPSSSEKKKKKGTGSLTEIASSKYRVRLGGVT